MVDTCQVGRLVVVVGVGGQLSGEGEEEVDCEGAVCCCSTG